MSKALVIGAGISGVYVAKLLLKNNTEVLLYDDKPVNLLPHVLSVNLDSRLLKTCFNTTFLLDKSFDLVIISPGVPKEHYLFKKALELNIKILSEIDFASKFLDNNTVIGITGTNGKSTTTSMIADIFKEANFEVFAGGNLGIPLSKFVLEQNNPHTVILLELSSFQLETTYDIKLDSAIFLNLSCNHIDRHMDMQNYFLAKAKILNLLKPAGVLFANELLKPYFKNLETKQIKWFKTSGKPNEQNAFVASLLACNFGIDQNIIAKALKNFKALPHRNEYIGEKNGVIFINDSKATTVEAAKQALILSDKKIHLLLGGVDKQEDFSKISSKYFNNIIAYYVFGKSKNKIANDLFGENIYIVNNLEQAFEKAVSNAVSDEVILLSPACASYDQYDNFEQRGEHFRSLTRIFLCM
jgi:UDP-N-acetylmuramoylalanine--D-glutamate ligase